VFAVLSTVWVFLGTFGMYKRFRVGVIILDEERAPLVGSEN
jgi:hypothetical protein